MIVGAAVVLAVILVIAVVAGRQGSSSMAGPDGAVGGLVKGSRGRAGVTALFVVAALVWAVTLPLVAAGLNRDAVSAITLLPYMAASLALAVLWWRHADGDGDGRATRGSGRAFSLAVGLLAIPQFFWAFVLIALIALGFIHGAVLVGAALRGRQRSRGDAVVGGLLVAAMATTVTVSAATGFPGGDWWVATHVSVGAGVGIASISAAVSMVTHRRAGS